MLRSNLTDVLRLDLLTPRALHLSTATRTTGRAGGRDPFELEVAFGASSILNSEQGYAGAGSLLPQLASRLTVQANYRRVLDTPSPDFLFDRRSKNPGGPWFDCLRAPVWQKCLHSASGHCGPSSDFGRGVLTGAVLSVAPAAFGRLIEKGRLYRAHWRERAPRAARVRSCSSARASAHWDQQIFSVRERSLWRRAADHRCKPPPESYDLV